MNIFFRFQISSIFQDFMKQVNSFKQQLLASDSNSLESKRIEEFLSKLSLKIKDFPDDHKIASIFEQNIKEKS